MSNTTTVRSLRLHARESIKLDTIEPRPCKGNDVRLKIAYCGICGSDIHEYLAAPIFAPQHGEKNEFTGAEIPVSMGHEMSGTVVEVGDSVTKLKMGDRVCVNPSLDERHYGLASCTPCGEGKQNLCKRWTTYGFSAPGGGFSDEIVVKDISCLVLPEGVSLKVGALAEPLAVAYHCIRVSGFKAGDNTLVLGAGPIGLAILLLLQGAKNIVISEPTQSRAEQAKKFGADMVINPLQKGDGTQKNYNPVIEAVHSFAEDGVDVVFDCTGLQSTLDTGLAALRPGGTFFNVAIHEKPLSLNLNDISLTEKKLLGGICYIYSDFEQVLAAMASHKIPFEQMITSVVPLENVIDGGFKELLNNKAQHVKILIQPDSTLSESE